MQGRLFQTLLSSRLSIMGRRNLPQSWSLGSQGTVPHVVVFLMEAGDKGLGDEPASLPHPSLGMLPCIALGLEFLV